MSANCAGIVGGQLFRSDDLPFYHRGWSIAVAFMAFGVACVITLIALYAAANARLRRSGVVRESDEPVEKTGGAQDDVPQRKLYNY